MIRFFDIVISFFGLLLGFPILVIICIVGFFDTGSPIFLQERVGKNKKPFKLIKFRTMKKDTASVASHLASKNSITKVGGILRKTKLDEIPQLINVLAGDMSLVGPRPNLFNQQELIAARDALAVYSSVPGITGLAQINNIDMSAPDKLARVDRKMLETLNLKAYFGYIVKTVAGSGRGDSVIK